MRKDARQVVFKVLYSELFNENDEQLFSDLCVENGLSQADRDFAFKLLSCVRENKKEFENAIEQLAKNYKLERIYLTDKCALFIGMAEIKYFDDVPNIVAIDEALSLCRIYSTASSLGFVNGIFAEYKKIVENKLKD